MPYRSPRPCKVPSCAGLTLDPSGYCPKHIDKKPPSDYRPSNKARAKFESSSVWKGIRRCQLNKETLCYDCMAEGRVKQAEEVHHVNGDHSCNLGSNLMSLCKTHHSKRTREEHGGAVK
jgi:5-methylcytosine-specific restriction protein A